MAEDTLPPFNPLSKSDLDKRAEILAKNQGFAKDSAEEDSFRHAYTAAMMTRFKIGDTLTEGMGYLIEAAGLARNALYSIGSIFDDGIKADSWDKAKSEMFKDLYNNQKGIEIGKVATDEAEIIKTVAERIRSGDIIVDSSESHERYNKEFGQQPMNLVASEDSTSPAGSFDPSFIFKALGGRSSKNNNSQALAISAAALAREVLKSRRRSLENDLLDIFTGGNGKTTLPQVGSGNSLGSFTNSFGGLIDNLVGSAMSRRKTRISTSESERSVEASRNWNVSRSQQQAMLAQWANQGSRNN